MRKAEIDKLNKAKEAARKKVEEEKAKQKETSSRVGVTKPGILDAIVEIIRTKGPIGKKNIHTELTKRFPDREADKMMKTVNCQIGGKKRPYRLETSRKVKIKIADPKRMTYELEPETPEEKAERIATEADKKAAKKKATAKKNTTKKNSESKSKTPPKNAKSTSSRTKGRKMQSKAKRK